MSVTARPTNAPVLAVANAVYQILSRDATVKQLVPSGVFDGAVPQDKSRARPLPWIVIDEYNVLSTDLLTHRAAEVEVTLQVFTEEKSRMELIRIDGAIGAALARLEGDANASLTMETGWYIWQVQQTSASYPPTLNEQPMLQTRYRFKLGATC